MRDCDMINKYFAVLKRGTEKGVEYYDVLK